MSKTLVIPKHLFKNDQGTYGIFVGVKDGSFLIADTKTVHTLTVEELPQLVGNTTLRIGDPIYFNEAGEFVGPVKAAPAPKPAPAPTQETRSHGSGSKPDNYRSALDNLGVLGSRTPINER